MVRTIQGRLWPRSGHAIAKCPRTPHRRHWSGRRGGRAAVPPAPIHIPPPAAPAAPPTGIPPNPATIPGGYPAIIPVGNVPATIPVGSTPSAPRGGNRMYGEPPDPILGFLPLGSRSSVFPSLAAILFESVSRFMSLQTLARDSGWRCWFSLLLSKGFDFEE
jgi:hypothetical protein